MNYVSLERQRIAKMNELGATVDSFIAANGIRPPIYPAQFIHDQPRPIEVMGAPPPGHPAAQTFDDGYTGLPDDGFGQQAVPIEPREPRLKPISITDLFTNPSPPTEYVWDGYAPCGVVTLFGAHGGTGKSTIALMLAVCTALGRPLFGVNTKPCNVLFVSLEDPLRVVRQRLAAICKAWLIDPAQLENLQAVDGKEYPELFAAEKRGDGEVTPTYHELHALVEAGDIGLVVIDNASDSFGGDEIQRRQVRAFMRELGKIAAIADGAVVLLAHVDKNTSRAVKQENSEGYSGSTAWHNSARSRLFLTRGQDNLLTLEHQKNNLGLRRDPIKLQWLEGGFPQLVVGYEAPGTAGTLAQAERSDDQNAQAILRMLAEFEGRGQFCSPAITSRNHVYAVLRSEPEFVSLKLRPDDTKRIVNQCQRAGWIQEIDYRTPDRKPHQRWSLTADGRTFAGLPAPTAPTAPTTEDGADSATTQDGAKAGAPTAPTGVGGYRGIERTEDGALSDAEPDTAPPAKTQPTNPNEDF